MLFPWCLHSARTVSTHCRIIFSVYVFLTFGFEFFLKLKKLNSNLESRASRRKRYKERRGEYIVRE